MCYRRWSFTAFLFGLLLTFIVMSSTASQAIEQSTSVAQGVEISTSPVIGRAPTALISVNNTTPNVGDEITVEPVFTDEDGDAVVGTYQWTLGGVAIDNATSNTYTLKLDDIKRDSELNVTVTPKTDPLSTDPSVGKAVGLNKPINIRWQGKIESLTWSNSDAPAVANNSEVNGLNNVKATVKDLAGNLLSGATVSFYFDGETFTSVTNKDGVATVDLKTTDSGKHEVKAKIDNSESFTYVRFVSDRATARILRIEPENNTPATANYVSERKMSVFVVDANRNPVPGVGVFIDSKSSVKFEPSKAVRTDEFGTGHFRITSADTKPLLTAEIYYYGDVISVSEVYVMFNPLILLATTDHQSDVTYEYATKLGFPTTGFKGAKFRLKTGIDNKNYNWTSSDTNSATVDESGRVTLQSWSRTPVTISASLKSNNNFVTNHDINIKKWFTLAEPRNKPIPIAAANEYCRNRGEALPSLVELSGGVFNNLNNQSVRGTIGGLWSEWGDLPSYGWPNTFHIGHYWSSTPTVWGTMYRAVHATNGGVTSTYGVDVEYTVCISM